MTVAGEHVLRSMRAEFIKFTGRGPMWVIVLPIAVALPMFITFLIAYLAERFAAIPGQLTLQRVGTVNAAYWVTTITVVMSAVAAAYGTSQESARGAAEYVRAALPRQWTVMVGKGLLYGTVGAGAAAAAVIAVLVGVSRISPTIYGQVSLADPAGIRLLWAVPVLAFFAAASGTGVGALVRSPAAAVGLVLFWAYVAETAVGYLPGGVAAQGFMPFLGSVYATGQDIAITAPWGPDGALVYVCVVFAGPFAVGLVRTSHLRRINSV